MAEPIIYTENFLNSYSTYNVSHGGSAIANAYDGDKDSQWVSVSANDDTTDVSIEVTFKKGSVALNRVIDRLIIVNHNWKNYTIYYHDGVDFVEWLVVTGDTQSTSIKTLSEQTTGAMKIVIHTTQTVNAEKRAGEIIACALQLDLGRDMSSYEVVYSQNVVALRMGDGGVQQQVKRFAPNRFEKYEARCAFDFVPEATLESLYDIKKTGLPFLWQPESISRPDEIFLVNWLDAWKYRYLGTYKTSGFRLEFTVAEV